MAKPWERPWSMEEIIANSENWSLAGDVALLNTLKAFADNVLQRVGELNDNVTDLTSNLDQAALQLEISHNKFRSLRNTQFIESRVYEDDETLHESEPAEVPKENAEKEDHTDQIKLAVDKGLAVIDKYFDKVEVAVSDSEDDNDFPSFVLRPKDPYIDRPLPYVIGTEEWHKSWHVGLEDSSSDTGTEKNSDDEKFSETDSESDLPVLDRSQIKGISDTSGSSESDFVSERNKPVTLGKDRQEAEEQQRQDSVSSLASRDNFARTLAAKLGDVITNHNQENKAAQRSFDSNRFPEDEVVNTRPLQKEKPPTGKFTDNLFFDEPPPLADEGGGGGKFSGGHGLFDDEDDEEDDWGKPDAAAQKSTVAKKAAGLFDEEDEEDSIFTPKKSILYPASNVVLKPPLFYDEPPALDDAEVLKAELKKTETKKPQEPPKKLSLFDSDDETEVDRNGKNVEGLFGDDAEATEVKPNAKKPTGGVSMLGGGLFDKKLLLRRPTSSSDDEDNSVKEENVKHNVIEKQQDKPPIAKRNVDISKRKSSSEDEEGEKSEEKQGEKKDIKKPIGGVSILGGGNLFDKKLLLRRRQSTSENEEKEAEAKNETKISNKSEAKSKIEKVGENKKVGRLFSSDEEDDKMKKNIVADTADEKKKKPTIAKRKTAIIEETEKKIGEEKKKVSLFDDEVDTAITVKKPSEKKKFNLFDDDDLFKDDLFSSKSSAITKSLTSSLFDDDEISEIDDEKSNKTKPKTLFDPPETDDLSSKPATKTTFEAPPPPSEEPPEDTFVDTEPDTRMSSGLFDSPPPDTDFDDLFGVPSGDVFPKFGDVTRTKSDLFGGETYDDLFNPEIQNQPQENVGERNTDDVIFPKADDGIIETKSDLFHENNDDLFSPESQSTPEEQKEQLIVHETPYDVGPEFDDVLKTKSKADGVTSTKPKEDDTNQTKPEVDNVTTRKLGLNDVTKTNDEDIGEANDLTPSGNVEVPILSDDVLSETTTPISESSKGEEAVKKTSPGKLKHNLSNLSINVGALMPGSAPPKPSLRKSKSSEPLRNVDFVEPDVEVLHSVTKDRAKVPIRRQPSTRRGRRAALRASSSDFKLNSQDMDCNSVEVSEKSEKPVKVKAEETRIERTSEMTEEERKKSLIDVDRQEEQKVAKPKKPVGGVSILGASLDLDKKLLMRRQASEEKVVEDNLFKTKPRLFDSDDDGEKHEEKDLFSNKLEKNADVPKKEELKKMALFSDSDDDDKEQDRIKPNKPVEGVSILGASAVLDQKLFTQRHSSEKEPVKKEDVRTRKQISLFDSEDESKSEDKEESDLFGSSSKTKLYQKSSLPKKSETFKKPIETDLFGDDEDDDDLFGGGKASSKVKKIKNTSVKKTATKKSLFSDDEEDDIFQSSSSATVKRPEPRQAVERKIPKSASRLETPTDDPLSDLLR